MKAQTIKKIAKEQVIDRFNPKTTRSKWRKIRNICAIVAGIGVLFIPPLQVIVLPALATKIAIVVTTAAGLIAGRTALDKKGEDE